MADDDTGQFVKLDGTQTVNNLPFTGAAWTVTAGAIATTSATPITIPVYPIGNDLSALVLTVAPTLGINPGDPVTVADSITGLNTMIGFVLSYAAATGALVVQIGSTFQFEIRQPGPRNDNSDSGYIPWYDFGIPSRSTPLLMASLGKGISFVDIGVIQIMIPEILCKKLHNSTFQASLTVTDSVNTRQMFIANLPIQYGGVSY